MDFVRYYEAGFSYQLEPRRFFAAHVDRTAGRHLAAWNYCTTYGDDVATKAALVQLLMTKTSRIFQPVQLWRNRFAIMFSKGLSAPLISERN